MNTPPTDQTVQQLERRLADLKYRTTDAYNELATALAQMPPGFDTIIMARLNTAKGLLTERP